MEFRAPTVATQKNAFAREYLTKSLEDSTTAQSIFESLVGELGNVVEAFPDWHPILTEPPQPYSSHVHSMSQLDTYKGCDHTICFVRGFVTCPYSEEAADQLVTKANRVNGLSAYKLEAPLYNAGTFPVVVEATELKLEADGTIRCRDALAMFALHIVKPAREAQVAETWWNLRSNILGTPHGSRSSLFVNQHAGSHMRKILEALNESGMYGPIKEWSLDMLSKKKCETIGSTLMGAAVSSWNKQEEEFEFELRGELCTAGVRDTWNDSTELSVRVTIGDHDLHVSGFYYPTKDRYETARTHGKKALALKFA